MKTFVLIIMILGTAIIATAQEPKTGKTFQQKKFNTIKTDSTEYFAISSGIGAQLEAEGSNRHG